MAEREYQQKSRNDVFKTIVFMFFMTTLLMFYCNDEYDQYEENVYSQNKTADPFYKNDSVLSLENSVKEGYVVWNDNCQIPNISAFDDSIKSLVKKNKPPKCSSYPPLTSVVLDPKSWSYTFKINKINKKDTASKISCCYSSIYRKHIKARKSANDDDRYTIEDACHPIGDSEAIPKNVEFMAVTCKIKRLDHHRFNSTVHKDVHAMVIDKGLRRIRNTGDFDKPSVLIVAIDSLSRLNLIRSMPKTYRVLETRGFMSLEGYTKVADNTFPNVIPIMTGMFVDDQLTKHCWKTVKDEMDQCPFLWKEFKANGFVTAYMEDEPSYSTYNFNKYGFRNAPTDYYSRPLMVAAEKLLPVVKFSGMSYCVGPSVIADRVYRYIEDFVELHKDHGYFALFWLNTFSHNDFNAPLAMDQQTADMLSRLLDRGRLDNAVTIMLSDHGSRFGDILETYVGWLEERMPALYMRLPPGYAAKYPNKYRNFASNKHRLTSPFDLHLTLKDLLPSNGTSKPTAAVSAGCPACRSLFLLADANRSCIQAGVNPHWCTCDNYMELDRNGRDAHIGGRHVVAYLNALIVKYKWTVRKGSTCAEIKLNRVISIRHKVNKPDEYLLVVQTLPGNSKFSVTVKRTGEEQFDVLGDISRINMYGFQSVCTTEWRLKKYCYCIQKPSKP
ncbi:uncharacterized protein LOC126846077 [Adelges cooleyi]|uniref:uncharacterized protein LOC126846077 n=1 Tax=Adelges cooleyi TaxID=133065 RepID=UPI00217F7FE3|nr:uncharacterized protein LOC126846077 [Adelges cooleyi]XP_050441161.1 uncharacterized protein LOC126846077 [Adelges cooleyi]